MTGDKEIGMLVRRGGRMGFVEIAGGGAQWESNEAGARLGADSR